MSKHDAIDREIMKAVQSGAVHEQSDLQALLKASGHEIPQATLSRRLKKLKIAKVGGVYKKVDLEPLFSPPIYKIDAAEPNLLVLHTHAGYASSLAENIDRALTDLEGSGVLGTIAGDDTVLLIVQNKEALQKIFSHLQEKFM